MGRKKLDFSMLEHLGRKAVAHRIRGTVGVADTVAAGATQGVAATDSETATDTVEGPVTDTAPDAVMGPATATEAGVATAEPVADAGTRDVAEGATETATDRGAVAVPATPTDKAAVGVTGADAGTVTARVTNPASDAVTATHLDTCHGGGAGEPGSGPEDDVIPGHPQPKGMEKGTGGMEHQGVPGDPVSHPVAAAVAGTVGVTVTDTVTARATEPVTMLSAPYLYVLDPSRGEHLAIPPEAFGEPPRAEPDSYAGDEELREYLERRMAWWGDIRGLHDRGESVTVAVHWPKEERAALLQLAGGLRMTHYQVMGVALDLLAFLLATGRPVPYRESPGMRRVRSRLGEIAVPSRRRETVRASIWLKRHAKEFVDRMAERGMEKSKVYALAIHALASLLLPEL